MKTAGLYQRVTNGIIAELEAGTIPWTQPWKNGKHVGIMPTNAATARPYSGINIPILWYSQRMQGYPTAGWMTFQQALHLGAHVRKGEHGTTVVFTKPLIFKGEEHEELTVKGSMLRTFTAFNIAQIDELPETVAAPAKPPPEGGVRRFVDATKADIRFGGNKACYVPGLDFVSMPIAEQFEILEHFHATELHELVHWSGAKPRLDRDLTGRFGTRAYAAEELIAEFGAAFLCAHLGVTGRLRHADYIANWLELLRHDDRAIFTATSRASQAADYLRAFSEFGERVLC